MRRAWKKRGRAAAALTLAVLALGTVAMAAELIITEREAAIRRDKRSYSPRVAVVREGEKVTLVAREDPWLRVEHKGVQGWLNVSSVTENTKIVLSSEAVASGVRVSEQSAGSRGFDEQVEKEYRAKQPELEAAFKVIEEIEKRTFGDEAILKFLEAGQLGGGGGQ